MGRPFRKSGSKNYYAEVWSAGRRRTVSLRTDNYGIAKAALGKLEHEIPTTGLKLVTKTEADVLVERFVHHIQTHQRGKGAQTDIGRLREFFGDPVKTLTGPITAGQHDRAPKKADRRANPPRREYAVQIRYVEQVTTALVIDFLTRLSTGRGIGPKTWNDYRALLYRFYGWAVRTQGINMPGGTNPVEAVPARKVEPPRIRFLTLPQVHTQLEVLEAQPLIQAMVATYVYAGLRREELLWLTREDVDLKSRVIHVRGKSVDGQSWTPKTNRNRRVPISETLERYLRALTPSRKSPWYFSSQQGCRWDPDNFSAALRDLNRKAGLDWSCADYRHTFGTQLAMAGRDERTIAELMGNSPAIVRRHYAAWLPEAHPEAVEFDHPSGPAPMENTRMANIRVEAHRRGLRLVREPA